MKKNNNNGMLVGILIGIIITLLVGVGLCATETIVFKSTATNDNQQNTENQSNEQNENKNTITNNITLLENECENGCNKTISNINGDSTLYVSSNEIKLDNTQILKFGEGPYSLKQVSIYNDIIITLQTESLGSNIIIYDFSGKVIKTIGLFNDEQGRVFWAYLRYSDTEYFNISDDGIISFLGTKHLQGVANTYIADSGDTIDLCTQGENINENEIVSGIFKIAYLGKNSFSDINYVSTKTTIKDIKSCN